MTAPTLPDSWALVARAQAGDTDAFSQLYRQHHPNVLRFIQYRVNNLHDAENLAGDVWIRVLKGLGRVEYQGRDFGAWLTTIARNIVADHFKSFRMQHVVAVPDLPTWDLPAVDDPEAETVASVQRSTAARLLADAMAELTPGQRRVIELRFFDGLDTTETAAVMGLELGASKTLQSRACASLRRRLAAAHRNETRSVTR